MTTNETLWFRDVYPFTILREELLPAHIVRVKKNGGGRLRIWSAACSTGEEPYSAAITSLEFYRESRGETACRQEVSILATDVSSEVLAHARAGSYDSVSMRRGMPDDLRARHFRSRDGLWSISDRIKELVEFKELNLIGPVIGLGKFDVVFLRNVLIYFSDDLKRTLFRRVTDLLEPGGALFLGGGETVAGYTSDFDVVDRRAGARYYRYKGHAHAQACCGSPGHTCCATHSVAAAH